MRYRLRTLLILLTVLPPLLWGVFALWLRIEAWRESQRLRPGFSFRFNVPAMGPAPLTFDFAFPVQPPPANQNLSRFAEEADSSRPMPTSERLKGKD